MTGGQARIVQDVPPFFMVDGFTSKIVGLNSVGLRRNGWTTEELKTLKSAYFTLYRGTLAWQEILQFFQDNYSTGPIAELTQFLLTTKRGIVRDRTACRSQLRVVESDDTGNIGKVDAPATIRATG
jgi:UDP-N-acetylglucosamine acyltransferase